MKAKITATIEMEYEFDRTDYDDVSGNDPVSDDELRNEIERDVKEGNIALDDATVSDIKIELLSLP